LLTYLRWRSFSATQTVLLSFGAFILPFEDEIAQQYCINKSDKQCHGKCHIHAIDEGKPAQESDTRKLELRFPEINEFVQDKFVLAIPRSKAICTFFLTNVSALPAGFASEVFRPPTQGLTPLTSFPHLSVCSLLVRSHRFAQVRKVAPTAAHVWS
jgi:hypothetical protein